MKPQSPPSPAAHGSIALMEVDRDLDEVMAVDAASFANPWTRDMFLWEERNSDVARLWVYRAAEGVIAYCAVWHIFDELHINNLAVLPTWRRHGVARELLTAVLQQAATDGVRRSTLEVRASNMPARTLYEAFGFRPAGVRKAYYTHPTEDAVILWCDLQAAGLAG